MRRSVETKTVVLPERDQLFDALVTHTCLKNCFGARGMAVSCCTMTDRNYAIGPMVEPDAFLARLSKREGREVPREEVFIDYEEGRVLFEDRPAWQNKSAYPAMRPNMDDPSLGCRFLGDDNLCTVHDIRPKTCADYYCSHLVELFEMV